MTSTNLEHNILTKQIKKDRTHLLKKIYLGGDPVSLIILSENEHPEEYLPKNLVDLQSGFLKDHGILMSSYDSKGNQIFSIQVTKPKPTKGKGGREQLRNFNAHDELKLKFLANFIAKKAENLLYWWDAREK